MGKAPFRCVGVTTKIGPIKIGSSGGCEMWVGSPGQAMGVCAYCGQGIADCFEIRSSDGKSFVVGCDCVARVGDEGCKRVVDKLVAEKRRSQVAKRGEAGAAYLCGLLDDPSEPLVKFAHPFGRYGATMADYVAWLVRGCNGRPQAGNAKIASVASKVRKLLA